MGLLVDGGRRAVPPLAVLCTLVLKRKGLGISD
jgi:hypothetical protein